jgi:ABC-type polar amino acid transport system ATPase subunit
MVLLGMNDITFRTSEREILYGLSLSIDAGEVHALLGTNGTGKSTLAYLVMGCEGYVPSSGDIVFDGRLREGIHLTTPVHTCFGVVHREGDQRIEIDVALERGSSAYFIAHCLFPRAERVRHVMDARIEVAEGASMGYQERHYHGPHGGIEVIPKTVVRIGRGGRYASDFTLTDGRVGGRSPSTTTWRLERMPWSN